MTIRVVPRAAAVDCARSVSDRSAVSCVSFENGFRMGSITDGVIETDQHPERFRVGGVFRRDVGSADESAKGRPGSATFGRLTSAPTRRRRVHRLRSDVKDPRRFSRRSKSRASRRCALAFAPVRTRSFSSVAARVSAPFPLLTPIASDPGPGKPRSSVRASARGVASSTNAANRSRARAALGVARRRARRAYRGVNLRARALVQPRSGDLGNSTSSTRAI